MKESQQSIDKKYSLLTEREKVLIRPTRYIGAVEPTTNDQWIFVAGSMINKPTTYSPAFNKLFDEIISNSTDHAKTPEGKHLNEIKIEIDRETGQISVYDNGGIPVKQHSVHKMYIPEMVFGQLHSGSNFDDDEDTTTIGSNGEGSSLVNIFSKSFKVETADGSNLYVQDFSDNMTNKTKPKITKSRRKFTRISWIVDTKYMKGDINDYDNYDKIIKRIYDAAACNSKIKFYINGASINFKNGFYDYIKLFSDDVITCGNDDFQLGFTKSKRGDFEHVSYVNGTESSQGGNHIDYVMDQLTSQIRTHIKKKTKVDIMPNQIRNHFMLFVNATIVNPRFDSQTKNRLVTNISDFKTSYSIPDKVIKDIIKSPIMESIIRWVEAKAMAEENKKLVAEQKKNGKREVEKHIEAAGDDPKILKFLHLTEGDSAIGNFVDCRDVDSHGGYPLRGKVLNVRERKPTEIIANNEIADIMSILNIRLGELIDYRMNYDYVVILTDADPDGDSICGQLLNFFSLWPELFKDGKILRLRTPLFIVSQGKNNDDLWFYNHKEFDLWCVKNSKPKDKDLQYIKGLGELNEEDYAKCLNEPVYQRLVWTDKSHDALELAFGKDAEPRKPWLLAENK